MHMQRLMLFYYFLWLWIFCICFLFYYICDFISVSFDVVFRLLQVPRESLLFVIPAFGGVVSWHGDGSPFSEADEDIMYQVHLLDYLLASMAYVTSSRNKF